MDSSGARQIWGAVATDLASGRGFDSRGPYTAL